MPLSASSNRPSLRSAAPVNAPFSWPNSSDSSSVSGQRRAVDRNERFPAPRRQIVDRFGDQFLPGAGFSLNQHGTGDRGHLFDPDQQLLNCRAFSGDAGTPLEFAPIQQPLDEGDSVRWVDRLEGDFGDVDAEPLRVILRRIGWLEQRQGRDFLVPGLSHQLVGHGLVDRTGEHQQIGALPPQSTPRVIHR